MHHAFALLQRGGQGAAQCCFVMWLHMDVGHGQLHRVLFESVNAGEACSGQKLAIYAKVRVAAWPRPVGQLGVHAFAVDHQRREQANVLATVTFHQLRGNALWGLRLHRSVVVDAMLRAQLHIQEPQKMPNLGGGAHGRLAASTAQTLLNGHRGRYAIHGIHLGAACGLHNAAGIGIERLQIAALAFVEQNIKRQGGFARARHPRDHTEFATRNIYAERLEVVLFGIHNRDAVFFAFGGLALMRIPTPLRSGLFHRHAACAKCGVVVAQGFAGVGAVVLAQIIGCANGTNLTARFTALGS